MGNRMKGSGLYVLHIELEVGQGRREGGDTYRRWDDNCVCEVDKSS